MSNPTNDDTGRGESDELDAFAVIGALGRRTKDDVRRADSGEPLGCVGYGFVLLVGAILGVIGGIVIAVAMAWQAYDQNLALLCYGLIFAPIGACIGPVIMGFIVYMIEARRTRD